jgi:single-strand DNA-binding protein
MNKVILIGRLTGDPELRYTPSGAAVANFTIAVDRPYTNKQGERDTDFIRIVAWRKLGEVCANNLGKGRLVGVCGRMEVRSYETQGRWVTEVIAEEVKFLDWPKKDKPMEDSEFPPDFDDHGDDMPF